jgi:hypothetical protein
VTTAGATRSTAVTIAVRRLAGTVVDVDGSESRCPDEEVEGSVCAAESAGAPP